MSLPCKWDVQIGKIIEFIDSQKGTKILQWSIVGVIIVQVGAFLVMWGSLTETVKTHDKNFERVWSKLDKVQLIGYAVAGEKGEQGKQGIPGKDK